MVLARVTETILALDAHLCLVVFSSCRRSRTCLATNLLARAKECRDTTWLFNGCSSAHARASATGCFMYLDWGYRSKDVVVDAVADLGGEIEEAEGFLVLVVHDHGRHIVNRFHGDQSASCSTAILERILYKQQMLDMQLIWFLLPCTYCDAYLLLLLVQALVAMPLTELSLLFLTTCHQDHAQLSREHSCRVLMIRQMSGLRSKGMVSSSAIGTFSQLLSSQTGTWCLLSTARGDVLGTKPQ